MRGKRILLALLALLLLAAACFFLSPRFPLPPSETGPAPEESPAAAPSPSSAPEPTPEPVPTPTPEPTPRPLQPMDINTGFIDPSLYAPCEEKGRVKTLHYETQDYYYGHEGSFPKQMTVYLPYGYTEERAYDVLFVLHTAAANENFWLRGTFPYGDGLLKLSDLLDNMIYTGLCPPIIVVGPSGYITDTAWEVHDSPRDYAQFGREFAEDILPCIVENFSTYAEGSSREALSAAREHFGVAGASFGSYMTRNSVLGPNLDLVANFAAIGGGSLRQEALQGDWGSIDARQYPIHRLYIVEGEYDDRGDPERSYYALRSMTDLFNDDNLRYSLIVGAGHDSREWVNGVYNSAQLFFRDDAPREETP